MRSLLLFFSFVALMGLSAPALQAQAACGPRPIAVIPKGTGAEQMAAHKLNFTNAVIAESVHYAETHRTKLVSFMERVIQKDAGADATSTSEASLAPAKPPVTQTPATGVDRQKEIIAVFKGLKIQDAAGITIAKSKLGLIDEFEAIMLGKSAASH